MAPNLKLFRLVTFATSLVFALILLGLNAHLLNMTSGSLYYFDFSALAVASGVLTMVSLPTMYIVDMKRKGAFTSWVTVEFAWLTFLWILWLAVAARTTQGYLILFNTGDCNYKNSIVATTCSEFAATMALGYVLWILLMGYTATIMTYAIIGNNRGNQGIWKAPVSELMTLQSTNNFEKGSPVLAAPPTSPGYPPYTSPAPSHPNQYQQPQPYPQYQQPQQYQQPYNQYGATPQSHQSAYPQAQV